MTSLDSGDQTDQDQMAEDILLSLDHLYLFIFLVTFFTRDQTDLGQTAEDIIRVCVFFILFYVIFPQETKQTKGGHPKTQQFIDTYYFDTQD